MQKIDLTEINWKELSFEEFSKLEKKIQEQHKIEKKTQAASVLSGKIMVEFGGLKYEITASIYQQLKAAKTERGKKKIIDKIISTYTPIEVESI